MKRTLLLALSALLLLSCGPSQDEKDKALVGEFYEHVLGLQHYMAGRGISNLADLVGELLPKFYLPHDLDRDTVVYPKMDRKKCIGCGRCYTSCSDGGHQAISFGEDRQPKVNGSKCVGCLLCRLVCPTGAIGLSKRIPKK